MQITTMHTLTFTIKTEGNEQHRAAVAIIEQGARTLGCRAEVRSMPLPEGEDALTRSAQVLVHCEDHDKCETYWHEAQRTLAFVGVEAVSP